MAGGAPRRRRVVTVFLRRRGCILIVRRSGRVGSYPGRWSAISGTIEGGESPAAAAARELAEETGVSPSAAWLVRAGAALEVPDPALATCWIVHPFLFDLDEAAEPRLDWENVDLRWIAPDALAGYATVPALREVWQSVAGDDGGE